MLQASRPITARIARDPQHIYLFLAPIHCNPIHGRSISALLVVGLIPILTGLASIFVLKEKYDVQQISGTALGLFGVALIAMPGLLLDKVD